MKEVSGEGRRVMDGADGGRPWCGQGAQDGCDKGGLTAKMDVGGSGLSIGGGRRRRTRRIIRDQVLGLG